MHGNDLRRGADVGILLNKEHSETSNNCTDTEQHVAQEIGAKIVCAPTAGVKESKDVPSSLSGSGQFYGFFGEIVEGSVAAGTARTSR